MANLEAVGAGGAGDAKADSLKRILAAVIDAVITFVVGFIPIIGGLTAAAYWLFRDGLDFEFMDHRSLGKKVMKLRPVGPGGRPIDLMTSVKRNWMFALGGVVQLLLFVPILGWIVGLLIGLVAVAIGLIELILVLTDGQGRRMGDRMAGTVVREVAEAVPSAA
jgi:uncharacterized RDD family membrane protein YckC